MRQYQTAHWAGAADDELIAVVARFRRGHELDGSISLEVFARLAGITLADGAMLTGIGDYWRDELILRGALGPEILEDGPA